MNGIRSATIVPFPSKAAAPPRAQPDGDDAARRLQAALAALERAVAGQRAAVASWRNALGELGGSVNGLHSSLRDYDARLGTLRGQLDSTAAGARALAFWADEALAAERDSQTK